MLPPVSDLLLQDFDFELPSDRIAQSPSPDRGASRLLHLCPDRLEDRQFSDLPQLLTSNDLLVFNDTKVIKARLYGTKISGGAVECLIERIEDQYTALSMCRASKSPKPGSQLRLANAFVVNVEGREGEFFRLRLDTTEMTWYEVLERWGQLPLPPYIEHTPGKEDEQRYQTVFAANPGAVAAPTAGLHFTPELLATLSKNGIQGTHVTLHVGAGTFQPVRVERIAEHRMHSECFHLSKETADHINRHKAQGGRVIAVGTTSLRALESAMGEEGQVRPGHGETRIFITPGYRFRCIDALITNFHLPKSTLLMLVSALAGRERIGAAYSHAIVAGYRFFSYGDAMFIDLPKN